MLIKQLLDPLIGYIDILSLLDYVLKRWQQILIQMAIVFQGLEVVIDVAEIEVHQLVF